MVKVSSRWRMESPWRKENAISAFGSRGPVHYAPRQHQQARADLQARVVGGHQIYLESQRLSFYRKADNPAGRQEVRRLTHRQDARAFHRLQKLCVTLRFRAAHKKDMAAA